MYRLSLAKVVGVITLLVITGACGDLKESKPGKGSWVKPHVTRNGRFIKGHYRNSVNYDKNSYRSRIRSNSYYQRNKYRYRKSK
ncbi:MAG: hypothetical protein RL213_1290 [Bacteroidota bacterium]|jgi:hypothetical protein